MARQKPLVCQHHETISRRVLDKHHHTISAENIHPTDVLSALLKEEVTMTPVAPAEEVLKAALLR